MMQIKTHKAQLLGCLAIFGSTFFLYLSTLVIRWSEDAVTIAPAYFVFARFILGFVVVSAFIKVHGVALNINKYHLLIGRAVTNCISVFCFYKAVAVTTVAEANILNMTYPLFVTIYSWIFLSKQRDLAATVTLLVAFTGVWLVLSPDTLGFKMENLWGLASGMFGAAAIVYLNVSRQVHATHTILFFLFGLGSLGIILLFHDRIFLPGPKELMFLSACAGCGVMGQYLLTLGFRYVTAVEGSIISSTRILLAAVLGPYLASDPHLSFSGWVGAAMIFVANVFLAARKANT